MKEVVFYALIFFFSTLAISSALTTLLTDTYYTFTMYFGPGVYNFTPLGKYYYHPSGPYTTLNVEGGGVVEVNGSTYVNSTTLQPDFYSVIIVPSRNDILFYYVFTFMVGALASLMIVMGVHRLLLKLASR